MNKFLQWLNGKAEKKELYLIIDNEKSEISPDKDIQYLINKLETERISSFGLSSVNPIFLKSKEEDLALSRALIENNDVKNLFYFRITRYQIVKPINFRLRLTFYSNNKIKQLEFVKATDKEISALWNHLILDKKFYEYNFNKWHDKSEWFREYLIQRETQELTDALNPPLMTNVFWNFPQENFVSKENFMDAVREYHENLEKKWEPNKVVLESNALIINYQYLKDSRTKSGKMTLKNENPWTMGDLLFAMHNKCVGKLQEQDNHFFQGLVYNKVDKNGIPTYSLNLGS